MASKLDRFLALAQPYGFNVYKWSATCGVEGYLFGITGSSNDGDFELSIISSLNGVGVEPLIEALRGRLGGTKGYVSRHKPDAHLINVTYGDDKFKNPTYMQELVNVLRIIAFTLRECGVNPLAVCPFCGGIYPDVLVLHELQPAFAHRNCYEAWLHK